MSDDESVRVRDFTDNAGVPSEHSDHSRFRRIEEGAVTLRVWVGKLDRTTTETATHTFCTGHS